MKRILVFITLLLLTSKVYAQVNWLPDGTRPFDDSTNVFFQIQANRSDYSDALSSEFVQTVLFGGYIDTNLKEKADKHLGSSNHYAGLLNSSIYATLFRDSSEIGFSLGYEYVNLVSVHFSDDLYRLALYGNKSFGENEIRLNNSKENYIQYQKFSLGLVHKPSGAFVSFGLYDGIDKINYDFGNMKMKTEYSSQNGMNYTDNISITTDNFNSSQSQKNKGMFQNGYGFGISGAYQYKLTNGIINFSIRDVGAIHWNNISNRDTSGTIDHNGLFWDFGSDSNEADIFDSLKDSLVPSAHIEDSWEMIPGSIEISYFTSTDKKIIIGATASYQWGLGLYPELLATGIYHYSGQNMLWLNGSFGGYYGASLGLGATLSLFDSSTLSVGSKYITGWISPDARATNIFVQYSLKL